MPCAGIIDGKAVQYLQIARIQLKCQLVFDYRILEPAGTIERQALVEMPRTVRRVYLNCIFKLGQRLGDVSIFIKLVCLASLPLGFVVRAEFNIFKRHTARYLFTSLRNQGPKNTLGIIASKPLPC